MNYKSLLARIKSARNLGELEDLLMEGRGYEEAKSRTRTRWKKAADDKRREFGK